MKRVTITSQGIAFTISVYQAAVGYSGNWEGDGESGSAGYMPTIEDVVTMAKLKIDDYLRQRKQPQ